MPINPSTGKLKSYRHKALQTASGSPIKPSMGGSQRLIGTVSLSRKELGDIGHVADKPEVTVKGRKNGKY